MSSDGFGIVREGAFVTDLTITILGKKSARLCMGLRRKCATVRESTGIAFFTGARTDEKATELFLSGLFKTRRTGSEGRCLMAVRTSIAIATATGFSEVAAGLNGMCESATTARMAISISNKELARGGWVIRV